MKYQGGESNQAHSVEKDFPAEKKEGRKYTKETENIREEE